MHGLYRRESGACVLVSLTRAERLIAVLAGWQAECAVQPHATRFATERLNIHVDICPTNLAGCIEFGRKMLRAHVDMVNKASSGITRCAGCGVPMHASETDDTDRCAVCARQAGKPHAKVG